MLKGDIVTLSEVHYEFRPNLITHLLVVITVFTVLRSLQILWREEVLMSFLLFDKTERKRQQRHLYVKVQTYSAFEPILQNPITTAIILSFEI